MSLLLLNLLHNIKPSNSKHRELRIPSSLPKLAFCPVESCEKENTEISESSVSFIACWLRVAAHVVTISCTCPVFSTPYSTGSVTTTNVVKTGPSDSQGLEESSAGRFEIIIDR